MSVRLMFVQENRGKGDFKKVSVFVRLLVIFYPLTEPLSVWRRVVSFPPTSLFLLSSCFSFGCLSQSRVLPVKTKLTSWLLQLHDKNVGFLLSSAWALLAATDSYSSASLVKDAPSSPSGRILFCSDGSLTMKTTNVLIHRDRSRQNWHTVL